METYRYTPSFAPSLAIGFARRDRFVILWSHHPIVREIPCSFTDALDDIDIVVCRVGPNGWNVRLRIQPIEAQSPAFAPATYGSLRLDGFSATSQSPSVV